MIDANDRTEAIAAGRLCREMGGKRLLPRSQQVAMIKHD
jgi:hypothetical protein